MKPFYLLLPLTLLLLSHTANADCESSPPGDSPLYLSAESPVRHASGPVIGQGQYSYRFVVREPRGSKRPYRHGRYQIFLSGDAIFPDGSQYFRGVTDQRGRTATFRFASELPLNTWFVEPLVGQGELSEGFRLSYGEACNQGRPVGHLYLVNMDGGPIFCGRTLPGGYTPRFMSQRAENLQIYNDFGEKACQRLLLQVNPIMANPLPKHRLGGLERLLRDRHLSKQARELIQSKADALTLLHGSPQQLDKLLQRQLAEVDQDSPQAVSGVYNDVGYNLLVQGAADQRSRALAMLEKSVELDENLFNLDSLAWALHLDGRSLAAIDLMDRGLNRYGERCTEAERSSLPIALAHRGMARWALGEYQAALTDWAQADLMTTSGGWTNFIPKWQQIKPLIKNRAAEMRTEGYQETRCTAHNWPDDEEAAPKNTPDSQPDTTEPDVQAASSAE